MSQRTEQGQPVPSDQSPAIPMGQRNQRIQSSPGRDWHWRLDVVRRAFRLLHPDGLGEPPPVLRAARQRFQKARFVPVAKHGRILLAEAIAGIRKYAVVQGVPIKGPRTNRCGKRVFKSRKDACETAARAPFYLRAYLCPKCLSWHLTSQQIRVK